MRHFGVLGLLLALVAAVPAQWCGSGSRPAHDCCAVAGEAVSAFGCSCAGLQFCRSIDRSEATDPGGHARTPAPQVAHVPAFLVAPRPAAVAGVPASIRFVPPSHLASLSSVVLLI